MHMRLGEALRVTLRGSSHGPFVGALVEGMPPGLVVNEADVEAAMALRKTGGTYSSKRKEADRVEWRTGVGTEKQRVKPLRFTSPTTMPAQATTVSYPTILGRAIKTW